MAIRFGPFELDEQRRQLLRDGVDLHLPPKGFLLLKTLVDARPNAISKRELYDTLWPATFVSDVNLPSLIAELRTLLGDDARKPLFIRTVHGFGYAFCAEADDDDAPEGDVTAVGSIVAGARHIALPAGETIIGRDPEVRCFIDDASVSRRHAVIVCDATTASIRDLDSKNGTFVRGARVTGTRELRDGDAIDVGSVRLVFRRPSTGSTITLTRSAIGKNR